MVGHFSLLPLLYSGEAMENEFLSKLKDRDGENGQASLDRKFCAPQPVLGCLDTD